MQYVGFDAHKKYTFFTRMDVTGQIRRQGELQAVEFEFVVENEESRALFEEYVAAKIVPV